MEVSKLTIKKESNKIKKETEQIIKESTLLNKMFDLITEQSIEKKYEPICTKIKYTGQQINKIIHIADIHIRLSSRHAEYEEVFEEFYNELVYIKLHEPNCLVCLCGDLLESKDELKPDTIILTWNFLKNISIIFPLIMISGNHDRIEQNDTKIDSIQSIINERPITNIHYLRDSGVYIYENIIFGVSSIVDKYILNRNTLDRLLLNCYPDIYHLDNIKKIGLYHGGVENATNNFNFIIPHCKNIADFGKYDYILLGDIHKFQYLNKEKTIAYSSSMISQNFGETDNNHGYLEWDLVNNLSKFHILYNRYAFNKIHIKLITNKQTQQTDIKLINKHLPNIDSGYLKIDYESVIRQLEIKQQINRYFPRLSIIFNQIYDKTKPIINEKQSDNKQKVLTEKIDINIMIREYLRKKELIQNEELIDKIIEYFQKIITKSTDNKIEYIGNEWKILYLSFDYMFGYGPNNVIDFTNYPNNEIIGIFGDNAIGKSSLIDIISFMLYSKTTREDTLKDIININSNLSKGLIIIESGGQKYMIQKSCYNRITTKTTTTKSQIQTKMSMYKLIPTTDTSCYKYNDEYYRLESLTEENRYKTTSILETIIGDLQNFILTSVLLQGTNETFKNKDNKQKKEFLCKILNIDHYSMYEKEINDEYKKIKHQIICQQKLIDSGSVDLLTEQNNNLIIRLNKLTIDKDIQTKIINTNENEKINLYTQLLRINDCIRIMDDITKDKILDDITLDKIKLNNIIDNIKSLETNINLYMDKINSLELIKNKEEINETYFNDKSIIDKKQLTINQLIDGLKKKLYMNQLIKIDKKYNSGNLDLIIDELNNYKFEYDEIKNKIINTQQLIIELKLISQKETIIIDNDLYKNTNKKILIDTNNKIKNEMNQISKLIFKNVDTNKTLDELNRELTIIDNNLVDKSVISILENKMTIIEDYEKFKTNKKELLYEKINELRTNKTNMSKQIDDIILILNSVLDPTMITNIIVERYNEFIKCNDAYNEQTLKKNTLIRMIENVKYNRQIDDEINNKKLIIKQLENIIENTNNLSPNLLLYDELINEINNEIKYKQIINELNGKLLKLGDHIDKLDKVITDIKTNNQKEIMNKEIETQITNLELELIINKELETKLESYKIVVLLEKQLINNNLYQNNILDLRKQILDHTQMHNQIKDKIIRMEQDIVEYELNRESIKSNNKINQTINILQNQILDQKQILDEINKQIIIGENQQKINTDKITRIKGLNIELERLNMESIIYGYLVSMTGINGIQLYLLNEYLEKISSRINNILEPFIHKKIELVLNKDRIEMNIIKDNKQIYTLSGMESFMLDLSLIIIINEISQIPKSNIMFIDESISVLDKNRIDNINDLFLFMKEYFNQVFMITHMKQVKSSIKYSLDIKKTNNYSTINNMNNMIDYR